MNKLLCILSLTTMLSSCSTTSRTTWLSAGIGSLTGATAGYFLADKERGKKTMQSAAISAVIGATIGYFTHKGLQERDEKIRKETLFNLDKYNVYNPKKNGKSSSNSFDNDSQQIIIFTDDNEFYKRLKSQK